MSNALRIFLSHKSTDSKECLDFKEKLEGIATTERLNFHLAGYEPGIEFAPDIYESLDGSDWLMLVYTNQNLRWDWSLFECGYFFGKHGTDEFHRIVVLHDSKIKPYTDIPKPLTTLHSVCVDYDETSLVWLLRTMFHHPPRRDCAPLWPGVADPDNDLFEMHGETNDPSISGGLWPSTDGYDGRCLMSVTSANIYLAHPLLNQLYSEIRNAGPLRSVSIDVTNVCNLRCKGCYFFVDGLDKHQPPKDESAFDRLVELERKRGTNTVTIVGGEPALVLDRVKKLHDNFHVFFVTNGLLPIPMDGFEEMNIAVSIWGDPETDRNYGGKVASTFFRRPCRISATTLASSGITPSLRAMPIKWSG